MADKTGRLLPLLLDVEQNLEQDLSLASLAARFGTSAFHFHRSFSDSVGETPKQHVERLRIEKAAMQLAISDTSVTGIAFALGFRNLETFSRRFKAALGYTPSAYRRMARAAQAERVATHNFHDSPEYYLSRARFETLPRMQLLARRHVGDYGALIASFSDAVNPWLSIAQCAQRSCAGAQPVLIGIILDDPTMTPAERQRADLCMPVRARPAAQEQARLLDFSGGLYAFADYAGDVPHLLQAYQGLADEIRRSRYTFREGAPLLLPRAANLGGQHGLNRYDVAFPVAARKR